MCVLYIVIITCNVYLPNPSVQNKCDKRSISKRSTVRLDTECYIARYGYVKRT